MGCINYGTTPIEVENVEKQEQAKEQANKANIDSGLLGESLKES